MALTRNNATGAQLKGKRSTAGILAGIGAVTLLLASTAATQSFAARFDYQKALGANFFHIYPPFAIFGWHPLSLVKNDNAERISSGQSKRPRPTRLAQSQRPLPSK
jgi:hypothetical protein